ncbi:hypothetical protein K2Y11_24295 [bacterium]|nr:hypothetical protein [bacterium]
MMNSFQQMKKWARANARILLVATGMAATMLGTSIAWFSRSVAHEARRSEPQPAHFENLDRIVSGHLKWAAQEDLASLEAHVAPIRDFFRAARKGTKAFAEDVLGWESKWKLATDYLTESTEHQKFIEERFAAHVFGEDQLQALIESSVGTYMQHLNDVDSMVLVRLQADLEGLPYDALPTHVDRQAIQTLLNKAIREAVASVQADFRGMVGRQIVSYVSGQVLMAAGTKLATSAGILGVGAGTGTVTAMGGLVLGVIVDCVVSWAYDSLYDPVGEIRDHLNNTLSELETLIIGGDDSIPGLEQQLRDYTKRRAYARTKSIRAAVLP